jgi:hypothetical protein
MAAGRSCRRTPAIGLPASRLSRAAISSACCLHQVHEPEQDLAALGGAHAAPRPLKGAAGGRDRTIDIGRVAFGDGGDDLLGGGIEGLEGAAGDG